MERHLNDDKLPKTDPHPNDIAEFKNRGETRKKNRVIGSMTRSKAKNRKKNIKRVYYLSHKGQVQHCSLNSSFQEVAHDKY